MKLSNTSEYALRILAYMAKEPSKIYTAKQLVEKLHISDKYLRQLMTSLAKKGLIYSIQGREGGYLFARDTNDIYVSDIIEAVEGVNKYLGCIMGFDHCSDENPCVMHKLWVKTRKPFAETFLTSSLAQLNFKGVSKF